MPLNVELLRKVQKKITCEAIDAFIIKQTDREKILL